MTILLLGAGAVTGALGTRAATLLFIGAGIVGARGATLPAAAVWTAATAAGLAAMSASPRRLALPVLGASAALGAGSARNSAVVLALWVIATAAAVLHRGDGRQASRWALTLCAADLPVAAAVVWTAFGAGFEGWPLQLDGIAVVLLLIAAIVRAPLGSGPEDAQQEPGLLTVRTQTAVLVLVAVGATDISRDVLVGAAIAGAAVYAIGGSAARPATRDVVQESGLLLTVVAAARLGWVPPGWEWGVLAGGTLMHNLRLRDDGSRISVLAGQILDGGGIGLPLLPGVLVALEGSARARGWQGVLLMLAIVVGLWARAARWRGRLARPRTQPGPGWAGWTTAALFAGTVLAGLWASVLTRPRPPAGGSVAWPPAWGLGLVVLAGAAAGVLGLRGRVATYAAPGSPRVPSVPDLGLPDRWARPAAVSGALGVLGTLAVLNWVAGVFRGFL